MRISYNEFIQLIQEFQKSLPVDLDGIAKKLKLNIYELDKMPDSISGMIARANEKTKKLDAGSGFYIVINGKHHENRKRFTLAHEISHFVLDYDKIGDNLIDSVLWRSENVTAANERAANQLAAEILMPWELISKELSNGTDVSLLPSKFKVSPEAMSIRLGIPLDVNCHDE